MEATSSKRSSPTPWGLWAITLGSVVVLGAGWWISGQAQIHDGARIIFLAPLLLITAGSVAFLAPAYGCSPIPVWPHNPLFCSFNRAMIARRKIIFLGALVALLPAALVALRATFTSSPSFDLAPVLSFMAFLVLVYTWAVVLSYSFRLFLPLAEVTLGWDVAKLHLRGASDAAYSGVFQHGRFEELNVTEILLFLETCGIKRVQASSPNSSAVNTLKGRLKRTGIPTMNWAPGPMNALASFCFRRQYPQVIEKLKRRGDRLGRCLPQTGLAIDVGLACSNRPADPAGPPDATMNPFASANIPGGDDDDGRNFRSELPRSANDPQAPPRPAWPQTG